MTVSNVEIANRALQKQGAKRISALDQDTPNARTMNAAFTRVRRALLRAYAWSFAIKRDSIAADSTDAIDIGGGTWKRYSLPNDFLRLTRDDESGFHVDWKVEGQYILSKTASPLKIKYIADIEDPNFYDDLFIEAFATKLAMETIKEVSDSMTDKDSLKDDFKTAIAEAKNVGFIEKEAIKPPEDPWLSARR